MQIYVQHGGQQLGPFTEAELKAQLDSGAITLQDHVWWQGQANWIPLSQSQFAPGAPAAPVISSPAAPGAPAPVMITAPQSSLPMWALILGCVSLLCSIFTAIPAIIVGHMGLSKIKKNPGMQGYGMALAGLILGYVFTVFGILYFAIVGVSVLIALGNQVKGVQNTINQQIESATNSADQSNSDQSSTDQSSSTNSDQSTTNSSDQSTNAAPAAPAATSGSTDSSTNAAPAAPSSTDTSTNSSDSSSSSTNSPAMNQ